jgi:hypothetical protein
MTKKKPEIKLEYTRDITYEMTYTLERGDIPNLMGHGKISIEHNFGTWYYSSEGKLRNLEMLHDEEDLHLNGIRLNDLLKKLEVRQTKAREEFFSGVELNQNISIRD